MPLTCEELRAKLWQAVDIAGGRANPLGCRKHISSLLFFKWISDRFDDEVQAAVAAGLPQEAAVDDPDEHLFIVPTHCRWARLTAADFNLAKILTDAGRALEEANPERIDGLLSGTDWNELSPQASPSHRDQIIRDLLNHFSTLDLRRDNLQPGGRGAARVVGEAYQQFIHGIAGPAARWGRQFLTPLPVVRLLVELLEPRDYMRVCDPAAGSGGMLIGVANHVEERGGDSRLLALYGQELDPDVLAMAKTVLTLHGLSAARLAAGDAFTAPAPLDTEGRLLSFDRVLAHPPFGPMHWGRGFARSDPHHRFGRYGDIPPQSRGAIAFLLHVLAITKPDGMAGTVIPHGVLYRGGPEGRIRRGMVEDDVIEAVIGLPANLFFGVSAPVAICVFNRAKSSSRQGKTLFMDASQDGCFRPGRGRNHLDAEHINRIVEACRAFEDVEGFAHVAGLEEIAANDFNLNISRYLSITERVATLSVADAMARVRDAERRRDAAVAEMDALLVSLGVAADR